MINTLKKAGLTGGESRVYLAITELGESSVGKIVDKSKVTKSIIYQILEKLVEKGLISFIYKDKTKHFQAESPENLIEFLEQQKENIDETEKEIKEIIPQLLMKRAVAKTSVVTVYEGFKGLMTAYKKRFEVLREGEEYLNLGLPATQPGHHHAYWKKDHKERKKRKIKARLLYDRGVSDVILKERNKFKGVDARKMPLDLESPSWIMTYKDVTVIAIPQGVHPITIEINNPEITKSFNNYFKWFWKKSKPFK
ncbi:hypothetical protein K8R33_01805 [archaeon]|nr:hypothetical protein [archaeon]